MGIFDRLFGKPDPTEEWGEPQRLDLVLDLDKHALAGIHPGDSIDRVAKFGRPENPNPTKDWQYDYYSRGISFSQYSDDRAVYEIHVIFDGTTHRPEGFANYVGTCIHGGKSLRLTSAYTLAEFVERFGNEYWRDVDDDETLLFYELGRIEWQVEFDERGQLRALSLVSPPILDDEEQRSSYGVDKPWPPR